MKARFTYRVLWISILINLSFVFNLSATVYTVDNSANTDDFGGVTAGTMTFVKCIRLASADGTGGAGGHRIYFNIGAAGQKILNVTTTWQQLTNTNLNNMIIDGSTQPFAGSGPHVIFVGSSSITEGISISGLTNVTLTGLAFRDFQISIKMDNAVSCTISNCFLGTNNAGTAPQCASCTDDAIKMNNGCKNNIIGGTTTGTRNIIFGHHNGVYITGANSSDNSIGCTFVGEPNIISANTQDGVYVFNAGSNNKVAGNIIGLDITGTVASATYSNMFKGIHYQGSLAAIIGGPTAGERNIVSGNGYGTGNDGIFLETGCHSSIITNCYIGLDVSGILPLANKIRGILILASNNCQIYSNYITSHSEIGIYLQNSTGISVKSNYIGLNVAGNGNTATLGNQIGLNLEGCTGTIIGGSTAADCNYISGNTDHGIRLDASTTTTQISGNKIGIRPSGVAQGNLGYGIFVHKSSNNTIGGPTTAYGNEIANNSASGVGFSNGYWCADGSAGNTGSNNNFVYRNIIHHNSGDGINLCKPSGTGASITNWFSENSIYCNSGIGINLTLSNGNNSNKAAPVLTTFVAGTNTINGTAGANDYIEVFIDNGCPTCQGKDFIGSTTANGAGAWSFSNPAITSTNNLTATATDGSGTNRNTSQFATCISVLPVTLLSMEAHVDGPNSAIIEWTTTSEINNNYFQIEKSYDGINFIPLDKVNGQGTKNGITHYSYTDKQVNAEVVYYRIRQVDIDGAFAYTPIVKVEMNHQELLEVYPNPANENIVIRLMEQMKGSSNADIILFNAAGQEVLSQSYSFEDGFFTKVLNVENLTKGIYFLHIRTDSNKWEKKILKD